MLGLGLLRRLARYGRYGLVMGLLAGVLLPGVAAVLQPWLPQLVMLLLFLTAVRIGHRAALAGLGHAGSTLRAVLVFQLGLPLCALALFALFSVAQTPYAMAVILVLAAPALTGSPNLSIMLGANPEPAFRLLILGTALLPLTMLPVFWLSPQLGDLGLALWGAFRLLCAITLAVAAGFALRALALPRLDDGPPEALDGIMTLALGVIVIALMGALGPALLNAPQEALLWMGLAFAVNTGMQMLSFVVLRRKAKPDQAVPMSIVAGNRNVALFLISMPPALAEPLLVFLGCYQVPMYLTPLILKRVYQTA